MCNVASCPTCHQRFEEGTYCPKDGTKLVTTSQERWLGDRYRLVRKVGEGAMGEVYEAEHLFLRKRVAVKILRAQYAADTEAFIRLQREAQSTSGIGHPNIAEALDFGHVGGQAYLVMEWLDGVSLDYLLEREPLAIATVISIARQVCSGLAAAHDRGVIHRDLKPANLFVVSGAGDPVVKVLDFGIAKLAARATQLTTTGTTIGTPNYMAPEQALGQSVDQRADIYSLGALIYEMLVGAVPFRADNALAVLHLHLTHEPIRPSIAAPDRDISPDLDRVVLRCLEKRPEDRFESMRQLANALDAIERGESPRLPTVERAVTTEELGDTPPQRRPFAISAGLFALVIALAVVAVKQAVHHERHVVATQPVRADAASVVDALGPSGDAASPAMRFEARGVRFTARASATPSPTVNVPFALAFELTDSSSDGRDAELTAELSVFYSANHEVVHRATFPIRDDRALATTLTVTRVGKHHVVLVLRARGKRDDKLGFDVMIDP